MKLLPDGHGNIVLYNKFWNNGDVNTVHPALIYADLVLMDDARTIELSKSIYDEFLK